MYISFPSHLLSDRELDIAIIEYSANPPIGDGSFVDRFSANVFEALRCERAERKRRAAFQRDPCASIWFGRL
jgi:hypothetical protein